MKAERKQVKPKFEPITLTIETEDEFYVLYSLGNSNNNTRGIIHQQMNHLHYTSFYMVLENLYRTLKKFKR